MKSDSSRFGVQFRKADYLLSKLKQKSLAKYNELTAARVTRDAEKVEKLLGENEGALDEKQKVVYAAISKASEEGVDLTEVPLRIIKTALRSRTDLYEFFTNKRRLYLPPIETCSLDFLNQLLDGRKLAFKKDEIVQLDVKRYAELSIKSLYASFKESETLAKYLPDVTKVERLDRTFFLSIINQLTHNSLQKKINEHTLTRAPKVTKNLSVWMTSENYTALQGYSVPPVGSASRPGINRSTIQAQAKVRKVKKSKEHKFNLGLTEMAAKVDIESSGESEEGFVLNEPIAKKELIKARFSDNMKNWMKNTKDKELHAIAKKRKLCVADRLYVERKRCESLAVQLKAVAEGKGNVKPDLSCMEDIVAHSEMEADDPI